MAEKIIRTKLEKPHNTKRQNSIRTDLRIAELWQLGLIGEIIKKLKDKEDEQISDGTNG